MRKAEKQVAVALVVAVGPMAVADWLASDPGCDRGCQFQLQHLKEHAVREFIAVLLGWLGLL